MVESTRLYFAYGAMLSPRTLERRGIRPVGPVLRAKLPNYRLVFDHRAGFGTLVATENKHEVHGVLMRLSPEDWGTLRRSEVGYVVEDVAVEMEPGDGDGSLTMASAFVSQSDLLLPPNSGVPTTRYLGLIKEGAEHHNLPGPYQQWLQSLDSVRSVPRSNYNTRRERRARAGIALAAAAALAAWIASL